MVNIQSGNTLGMAVLKALGIDHKGVRSLSINMDANELATVTIIRSMDKAEADQLVTELRNYVLFATGGTVPASKAQATETVARNLMRG